MAPTEKLSRPASAGFVGAFRAAIRPGRQGSGNLPKAHRPVSRPCSAIHYSIADANTIRSLEADPVDWMSTSQEKEKTRRKSKLGRPVSAPVIGSLRRSDEERRKCDSDWNLLANHDAKLHWQQESDRLRLKREMVEGEKLELRKVHALQAKSSRLARHRQKSERENMRNICKEYRREQLEEKQLAKRRSLEIKAEIESQVLQSKQRHAREKLLQLKEDEIAKRECARVAAEEATERAAEQEARRQEMVKASVALREQAHLKRQSVIEAQDREKKLVEEYARLMERQDAARAAKLKEMADDQERRMAMNQGAQQVQQARDDAMAERIERHWKEKYAADDAKLKKESLDRRQRMEECASQRRQQQIHNEELLRLRLIEEQHDAAILAAQHRKAVEQDMDAAAARHAQKKGHQRELLAQIAEVKARVPLDMSKVERDINMAALSLAASAV